MSSRRVPRETCCPAPVTAPGPADPPTRPQHGRTLAPPVTLKISEVSPLPVNLTLNDKPLDKPLFRPLVKVGGGEGGKARAEGEAGQHRVWLHA